MAGTVVFIEAASNDGGNPGATASKVADGSTVTGWISSASVAVNTDIFLTGTSSISDKVSAATVTGYGLGAGVVGEPWNFSSGGGDQGNHIFMIANIQGTADTLANGGFGIIVADDLATDSFGTWYVGPQTGSLGGWEYFVINPAANFNTVTAGSATWTTTGNPAQLSGVDGVGVRWKVTNTIMGASDNAFIQTLSIGVGYRVTGTDAVFSEISTYEATNRFGALQTKSGTLFPLCKIRIGQATGVAGNVTFSDTGFNVTWQGQALTTGAKATADGFYGLFADKGTGTTDITFNGGSLSAASPEFFDLELAGVTSVTVTNLSVDRARVVTLDSAVDWQGGTVKNSGQIDASGAIFTNINVLTSVVVADEGALLWDINSDPDGNLDGCTFTKGTNDHHAIRFGTNVPATMTLRNCTFSGFSGSDDVNGSVFRFDDSNQNITLNLVNCTSTGGFSVDDAALSPNTVTIVIDPVTTLVNIKDFNGNNEEDVAVYLEATYLDSGSHTGSNNAAVLTDSGQSWTTSEFVGRKVVNTTDGSAGTITANTATTITATLANGTDNDWDTGDNYIINANLPVDEPVSITRGQGVGNSTAVVTHTAHGMNTNEYIKFSGITNDEDDNSGAFQITVNTVNEYQYTSNNSGNLSYTGDIRATGATIYGTTDSDGNISSSRTYSSNQPLTGYARKSDDGVNYFKPINLDDTVNNATGLTINRRLIDDGLV
jgi:hypothetical protein